MLLAELVTTNSPAIELAKARAEFARDNLLQGEERDEAQQGHPDCRQIACPTWLLHGEEWEIRQGRGYVLGDGSWFDPVTGSFSGYATV